MKGWLFWWLHWNTLIVYLQMAKTKTFRGNKRQSWADVTYWPSTQLVEKKQMLRVSRGLSWVNSGERVWGSDSPVRDELSTFTGKERKEERERCYPVRLRARNRREWGGETDRVEMKAATSAALLSCQNSFLIIVILPTFLYRWRNYNIDYRSLITLHQNPVGWTLIIPFTNSWREFCWNSLTQFFIKADNYQLKNRVGWICGVEVNHIHAAQSESIVGVMLMQLKDIMGFTAQTTVS